MSNKNIDLDLMRAETLQHILMVRNLLDQFCIELLRRGKDHDQSKLGPEELEVFAKVTPKLKKLTYGSPEYKESLQELGPALEHHYQNNRHHPEFHPFGINDMNLVDLVEMFLDWWAATQRHTDGCIRKSIDFNKKRFDYPEMIQSIFHNTVDWFEGLDSNGKQ